MQFLNEGDKVRWSILSREQQKPMAAGIEKFIKNGRSAAVRKIRKLNFNLIK